MAQLSASVSGPNKPRFVNRSKTSFARLIMLTAMACSASIVHAQVADVCEEIETARSGRIEREQGAIDEAHTTMGEARDAMADCMIDVSTQIGNAVGASGALGKIVDVIGKKMSSAACAQIKKQSQTAIGKVNEAINKAGNGASGVLQSAGGTTPAIATPGISNAAGAVGGGSTWDELGKLLGN
ncbi:hypothetical protein [Achromobacter anxifer]|uniref:hypothetical protein n=1 Tax=Achromobacter anxifer TaxID=1287737 RepID=UPI0023F9ACBB|nr:hypothetical protein [Achromobacter anxifer]MDF8359464.1 hypothetical protein [Achromobacter anxifer]